MQLSFQIVRVLVTAMLFVTSSCDLPRDPYNTSEKVRNSELRVGVVGTSAQIREDAAVLETLAARLDATVKTQRGETHMLIEALNKGEIDLIVSLPYSTAYKKEIGATRRYWNKAETPQQRIWAVRPGENAWLMELNRLLEEQQ